ncbi:MAG TPA: TonB-dependent receptor, partial [Chitinophagaceae bacterium]
MSSNTYTRAACVIVVLLQLCVSLNAQDGKNVTGNFINIPFGQFATEVESQTGFHVYYDPREADSIHINYVAVNEPVDSLLQHVLSPLGFHFSSDFNHNIFITRSGVVQTTLPVNFFSRKEQHPDSVAIATPDAAPPRERDNKLKVAEENKLYEIGPKANGLGAGTATVAGYVRDARSGEPIVGANIYSEDHKSGTTSDQFGYYSLTMPKGRHTLMVTSIGMNDAKRQVVLYGNGRLTIELSEFITTLTRVVVSADKTVNVKSISMGMQRLSIRNIKQIPTAFGEADVLRTVLTLPGVTSVGESSTGLNVRGGSADQNLILFGDATIYNPSHLFGFFSSFNPDVIKDAQIYKSSIPEKYGGRLASVLDVSTREGNKKKFTGAGGIGPLTAKFEIEGPIDSGRTSFILAGRTSYSDWLLKQIPDREYKNSSANFYDINFNVSHEIDPKNNLYLTAYISQDRFKLNNDTLYHYTNRNANIKWKHIYNNKLYSTFLIGTDNYEFSLGSKANPVNAYNFQFDVQQENFRADFNFEPSTKHTIDFGLTTVYYSLHPGKYVPTGGSSIVTPNIIQAEQGLESALYLGDKYDISTKFSLSGGIRFSMFNYLGAQQVYEYGHGLPRSEVNMTDTVQYAKGKVIKTYMTPELRLSGRYSLSDKTSVKLSVNTLSQYIHMLSNTTAISPTDIWKLSDQYIKPEYGEQVSLGVYRNFKHNTIETSIEVYYKRMKHVLDYKPGAQLILNHHIETDVLNAKGKAYGAEFLIRKTEGKVNGWISYTYSRVFLQTDDPLAEQPVNGGAYFPGDYDKPHVVNFISNYRASHRFSVSLNVIYSTGRPITLPIAEFYSNNSYRV